MTDNEIIKSLECCGRIKGQDCDNCPLTELQLSECTAKVATESLDLINRQKAENDRLKTMHSEMCIGIKVIKRNAIKNFAERLKRVVATHNGDMWSKYEYIDNLVKEMEGEK